MNSQKSAPARKPLQKDVSFWIVVAVVIGTVNVIQYNYGLPWITARVAASKPAPRNTMQAVTANGNNMVANQQANLDFSKKTYPWQVPRFDPTVLQNATPQVVIISSEYSPPSGGWSTWSQNGAIGIRVPATSILQAAYAAYNRPARMNRNRFVFPPDMPAGSFDFIATGSTNVFEGLQKEIKDKWGLVAGSEIRDTNVLVLTVLRSDAPGLKPGTPRNGGQVIPQSQQQNMISWQDVPFSILCNYLENVLRRPVIDQTGLTGNYDIQFSQLRPIPINPNGPAGAASPNPDRVASALDAATKTLDAQLGLQLSQSNAPVEYLVVKKADL